MSQKGINLNCFIYMNADTILLTFVIVSLAIGITVLTIYSAFGPGSESLIDPFEEDAD